jgi:hypothetical protein
MAAVVEDRMEQRNKILGTWEKGKTEQMGEGVTSIRGNNSSMQICDATK